MKKFISILISLLVLTSMISCNASFEIIKKGAKGDIVVEIQTLLTENGYPVGTIDGDFGKKTENAIKEYQADNGLEVNGNVDEATYEKLNGWANCVHEYEEWRMTEEPTCTTSGIRMHTCSLCGKYEYEDIPAIGHTLVNSTITDTKVCSVCGLMDGEIKIGSKVAVTDHAFDVVDVSYKREVKENGVTYYTEGDGWIAITLNFTNLASEAYSYWTSTRVKNISLMYDGKYTYNGETFAFDDIVPLGTRNLFILYPVPDLLRDFTDKNLIAEFTIDGEYYVIRIA